MEEKEQTILEVDHQDLCGERLDLGNEYTTLHFSIPIPYFKLNLRGVCMVLFCLPRCS